MHYADDLETAEVSRSDLERLEAPDTRRVRSDDEVATQEVAALLA